MVTTAAFWLFLTTSLLMLALLGGRDGRMIATACVLATLLTFAVNAQYGFTRAQLPVAIIDSALLLITLAVALASRKFWPLWFAGFQTITAAFGVASQLFPAELPKIYAAAAGFWALPALGSAVIGIMLDRRAALTE